MKKTCGQCEYAKAPPPNAPIGQRTCKGGPPQLVLMPGKPGTMELRTMYPGVNVADEACGAFVLKQVSPDGDEQGAG